MSYFLQQLINGITLGAVYGLVAIGYTMVYGIIGMINFAHGEIYMVSAFIAVLLFAVLGLAGVASLPILLILVLLGSMVLAAIYGWGVNRLAYKPLRHSPRLAPLISAIGVSIILQNFVQITQGAGVKTLPSLIEGGWNFSQHTDGLPIRLGYLQAVVWGTTLLLMAGFTWLIKGTSLGRAQRATEQDKIMAALCGVNVERTISFTFMIGAALAAMAGVLITLMYGVVEFNIGFLIGVKAFSAAVLGGIGSLPGAILGGLLLGLIETFWAGYANSAYKDIAAFAILILVLMLRPCGLLGRVEVEKI
ncbi:MAG: ABC transporter permease subunit [Alphaproteobacteria bacterium]